MAAKNELTQDRLKELLRYDPASGIFVWKVAKARRIHVGDIAGHIYKDGYIVIGLDGYVYQAHRLAWLYVHGEWPDRQIDHRNTVKTDNRLTNLRLATTAENLQNCFIPNRGSASRYRGVSASRGRWQAAISVDGKAKFLGRYATEEEAHDAYLAAKAVLHPFAVSNA